MATYNDFHIKYDPAIDTQDDIIKRILYVMYIKRLKAKKPAITFLCGDSGEGKSMGYLRLCELMLEIQGLKLCDYMSDVNVYVPLEYPQKIRRLLHEKELKGIPFIAMHEAREVVKAKMWQSFLTQAVADINAMSRSIKRLAIFIISQFIRDITPDMRYTINYYMKISRPIGMKSRLYWYIFYKDDRDPDKPKLRKRKLSGTLIYPNGRHKRFKPKYIELSMPSHEVVKIFEEKDREAKTDIINRKIDKLIKEMEQELGTKDIKIDHMVKFYTDNLDSLRLIGKRRKKSWAILPEFKKMHDLTPTEAKDFQNKLNEKLKNMGVIE